MDFSNEIMITFGLNLAGYIIVALLVYVLLHRRGNREADSQTFVIERPAPSAEKAPNAIGAQSLPARIKQEPEFVALSASPKPVLPEMARNPLVEESEGNNIKNTISRSENRRAIYQEARRLLARGKSHRELMQRLPLTEDELEMLSVVGNA